MGTWPLTINPCWTDVITHGLRLPVMVRAGDTRCECYVTFCYCFVMFCEEFSNVLQIRFGALCMACGVLHRLWNIMQLKLKNSILPWYPVVCVMCVCVCVCVCMCVTE